MSTSPEGQPRIADVARLAGVSAQTVSNVINQRPGFSTETGRKVREAIQLLGYRPNRSAQGLRTRRTRQVGFDLAGTQLEVSPPFTVSFLRELVRSASDRGYTIAAFSHEPHDLDSLRANLRSSSVDGFVLSDSPRGDMRARILYEANVPFVVFGRTEPELPQAWVDIDNFQAMRAVVDHLVHAGRQSFAYVGFPEEPYYWNRDRRLGTVARLAEHGYALPDQRAIRGLPDDVTKSVFAMLTAPDRPDAVICSSDALALAVANTAASLGIRVGEDVALTGFDAGPLRTMTHPPLTSVLIPVGRIADEVIDMLLRVLSNGAPSEGLIVPTELVLGGSA